MLNAYQVDNSDFKQVGVVDQLISVDWKKNFSKYGEATIKVIPTKQNIALLKKGVILSPNSKNAIKVDTVEISEDKGNLSLQIKGLSLEKLLTTRVSGEWYWRDGGIDAPEIITTLVNSQLGPSAGQTRGLRHLVVSDDIPSIGPNYERQGKGGLYDIVEDYCNMTPTMGYEIQFLPDEQKLLFQVLEGIDHSATSNSPVIFSNSLENLLSFDYYTSSRGFKNYAYVFGELTELGRTVVHVGDTSLSGYDRYEYFVDARDLQSETDTGSTLTPEEYQALLIKRGNEKLSECKEVETVSGKLNVNNSTFTYGVDYKLGDKVTVVDENIGVQVDAQIIGLQERYTSTYTSELIVGYEMPTVSEKIKTLYG